MLNLPRFLFINGPAGSGKSTLATLLCSSNLRTWRESFAEPVRQMIYSVFLPDEGPVDYQVNLRDGPTKKKLLADIARLDNPAATLTVRQTMIDFSEQFMKPRFGAGVFGNLLWHRCEAQSHWYDHFVIDDSGFAPEADFIINKVGAKNCALIQLHRAGCDFSGDSRGYITLFGVRTIKLENDGAPAEMLSALQLEFGNL